MQIKTVSTLVVTQDERDKMQSIPPADPHAAGRLEARAQKAERAVREFVRAIDAFFDPAANVRHAGLAQLATKHRQEG